MSLSDYKAWEGRFRTFVDAVFAGLERAGFYGPALEESAVNFIGDPDRFTQQSYEWAIEGIGTRRMGGFFTVDQAATELGFDKEYFLGLAEKREVYTFRFGSEDLFSALEIRALNKNPGRFAYPFDEALEKLRTVFPDCDVAWLKRRIAEGEIRAFRGDGEEWLIDRGQVGKIVANQKLG